MNSEYRLPLIIQREIRDLELANQSSLDWIEHNPDDSIIKELILQSEERKKLLLLELQESLQHYRYSYFKYAFKISDLLNISTLIEQLSAFSGVINKTASVICGTSRTEIPLYLNAVVQSSFGLMLSTKNDNDLLGGLPVQVFDKFFEILSGLDTRTIDILDLFAGNKELLRAYRAFFKNTLKCGYEIEFSYGNFRKTQEVKALLSKEQLSVFYKQLADYEENVLNVETIEGTIQGVDLIHRSILVVPHTQKSAVIKIFFDEDRLVCLKSLLGEEATIRYEDLVSFDPERNIQTKIKNLIYVELLENP